MQDGKDMSNDSIWLHNEDSIVCLSLCERRGKGKAELIIRAKYESMFAFMHLERHRPYPRKFSLRF